MKDWQIVGTVEIGSLHARYVATIDHHRAADLPTLFTENGVLASVITGRSTPKSDLRRVPGSRNPFSKRGRLEEYPALHHPPSINFVDEGQATSECYLCSL